MAILTALAGNPNVGKSTIFNNLTGMRQHTGNWPGKTVGLAEGRCIAGGREYTLVDLPGTYSLMAHSAEEETARNFICFERPHTVIAVCDATCLQRSLVLALQIMELGSRVILCVNLMDEARRKGISIDLGLLEARLGLPVIGVSGRNRKSLRVLTDALAAEHKNEPPKLRYCDEIERCAEALSPLLSQLPETGLPRRWLALKLLENDADLVSEISGRIPAAGEVLNSALAQANRLLAEERMDISLLKDKLAAAAVNAAEDLCRGVITYAGGDPHRLDRRIDRVITGRAGGYPLMLALLALVLWLTIEGANYPSRLLSELLFRFQDVLSLWFFRFGAPSWLHDMLVLGVYRVLAWVISVMLPPMAIFFPLFTLLEDAGYLPRVAYNLDKAFQRCHACGKQALCMAMGFGCNAVGITGARIIDSPRERLLAILTNSFVPCNGRFPTLTAVITMFFIGGLGSSLLSSLLLTAAIVLCIAMTFAATRFLSSTVLKGIPSSFTLELPPYRPPQVGKVIVRSVFDRTLFVLGRAAAAAAPAGLIIWLMANLSIGELSLLSRCAAFLEPMGRLMGLDGVILLAFILGLPANEIVLPIIIMAYTAQGSLLEPSGTAQLHRLLTDNGWTWTTAVSMLIFTLFHWPCSTSLITVFRETRSVKWLLLSAALPTAAGMVLCTGFTAAVRLFIR